MLETRLAQALALWRNRRIAARACPPPTPLPRMKMTMTSECGSLSWQEERERGERGLGVGETSAHTRRRGLRTTGYLEGSFMEVESPSQSYLGSWICCSVLAPPSLVRGALQLQSESTSRVAKSL